MPTEPATLCAAACTVALPCSDAIPVWGRPQAQLIVLEGDSVVVVGTLDSPVVPPGLAAGVAEGLGLPRSSVFLAPSGAAEGPERLRRAVGEPEGEGPSQDAVLIGRLVDAVRGLVGWLVPARLRTLAGHRWDIAGLTQPSVSTWGARLERRHNELEGTRPDAGLERLAAERNGARRPPNLRWDRALVDARLRGFVVQSVDDDAVLAVFCAVSATVPALWGGHGRVAGGIPQCAREAAQDQIMRKSRRVVPVVALAAGVSADAELRAPSVGAPKSGPQTGPLPAARELGVTWGRAVAAAALAPGDVLTMACSSVLSSVKAAGAPVRDGASALPETGTVEGRASRSELAGLLAAMGPMIEQNIDGQGVVHGLDLGGLKLLGLPAQLTTGLAGRLPRELVLVGPTDGHLGGLATPREMDQGTIAAVCPWGREAGLWMVEQVNGLVWTPLQSDPLKAVVVDADVSPVGDVQAADTPAPNEGFSPATLHLRRHQTPGGGEPMLRVEVLWVGDAVEVEGPWVSLHTDSGPLMYRGAPVDDLHRGFLIASQPHGTSTRWRARWSIPMPRRWTGRVLTAELSPWSQETEARTVP